MRETIILRYFDWIWHIRGRLALQPGQTADEAFDRLTPMFEEKGTTYERAGDTLVFSKKDQAAQDQMSIFDGGVLEIEAGEASSQLSYNLKSRALLACFIAPLIFLAFAQLAVGLSALHDGGSSADRTAERGAEDAEEDEEEEEIRLHPIDKFLGAPAPKQPGEDEEDEAESDAEARAGDEMESEGEDGETSADGEDETSEEDEDEMRHAPGPAYVFAAIFAAVYLGGRLLEDWLIKRRFRRRLFDEETVADAS